jgi:hypothetical protein
MKCSQLTVCQSVTRSPSGEVQAIAGQYERFAMKFIPGALLEVLLFARLEGAAGETHAVRGEVWTPPPDKSLLYFVDEEVTMGDRGQADLVMDFGPLPVNTVGPYNFRLLMDRKALASTNLVISQRS